jgi:hypothetical protein
MVIRRARDESNCFAPDEVAQTPGWEHEDYLPFCDICYETIESKIVLWYDTFIIASIFFL